MSEPPNPKVLRRSIEVYFDNATEARFRLRELLRIPAQCNLHPKGVFGYLPYLDVRDSSGKRMIVLPRDEFTFSPGQLVADETAEAPVVGFRELTLLPIQLSAHEKEWEEEIELNYRRGREPREFRGLIKYALKYVKAKFQGITPPAKNYAVRGILDLRADHHLEYIRLKGAKPFYVAVQVPDKYQIQSLEVSEKADNIRTPLMKGPKGHYDTLEHDAQSFALRFGKESDKDRRIYIGWKIVTPRNVRSWVFFGALTGILAPLIALRFFQLSSSYFPQISPLLLGVIAFMAGLRLLVFYDTELLSAWSDAYILLIFFNFLTLADLANFYFK